MKIDLYQVLGVKRDATRDEIKAAFKKLAQANHPDKHGGDENAARLFANSGQGSVLDGLIGGGLF